jgi:hypothetical protein
MIEATKIFKDLLVLLTVLLLPVSMHSQDLFTQTNNLSSQNSPYLLQHAKTQWLGKFGRITH